MAPYPQKSKNVFASLVESVGCEGVFRYSAPITKCALAICGLDALGSLSGGLAAVLSRATAFSPPLFSRCHRADSIPAGLAAPFAGLATARVTH